MENVRGSGSASRAEAAPAEGQRGGRGVRCTAAEDPSSARGLAERRSSPPEAPGRSATPRDLRFKTLHRGLSFFPPRKRTLV